MEGPPGSGREAASGTAKTSLVELEGPARERGIPVIRDGFVGVYRWHAKRTLKEVPIVRAVEEHGEIVGLSLLDLLVPEVGYVYYLAVLTSHRGRGLGGVLLDDALDRFRSRGAEVVYAAVGEENAPSRHLFERRGFRPVARKETGWREGGLGAWGLRSRMRIVPGELLLGVRLRPPSAPPPGPGVLPTSTPDPGNG